VKSDFPSEVKKNALNRLCIIFFFYLHAIPVISLFNFSLYVATARCTWPLLARLVEWMEPGRPAGHRSLRGIQTGELLYDGDGLLH
jgi:hypothetical protein